MKAMFFFAQIKPDRFLRKRWKPMINTDPTIPSGNQPAANEAIVTMDSEASSESRSKDPVEFTFRPNSLRIGVPYKVNVHALVSCAVSNTMIESKELHQKIEAKSEEELSVHVQNDNLSLFSGNTA
jgi:hypothetical protein